MYYGWLAAACISMGCIFPQSLPVYIYKTETAAKPTEDTEKSG